MLGRITTLADRIALAAIAGAHGVTGELRLKLFGEGVEALSAHRRLLLGGAERELIAVRPSGKLAVARFKGVNSREAAEALRGSLIEVERTALPPLGDGEYYHVDLIGLSCFDGSGAMIGSVVAVENFGAGDLLEVETSEGKRSLIPFKPGIADLEDGRINLDPDFLA
jgi:16S rRNA processing protein RimM